MGEGNGGSKYMFFEPSDHMEQNIPKSGTQR